MTLLVTFVGGDNGIIVSEGVDECLGNLFELTTLTDNNIFTRIAEHSMTIVNRSHHLFRFASRQRSCATALILTT